MNRDRSRVALVRCLDYDPARVDAALRRAVSLLGGAESFAAPGERIVIKPNLLAPEPPERNVSPHPAVFSALIRLLLETGAIVEYGDSPPLGRPLTVASRAGLAAVADRLGIALADFEHGEQVSFPAGRLAKQLNLARGALGADGIVNLAKLKTHGFTRYTGAVKNMFGCVVGLHKPEYHVKMPDIHQFCQVLVDIQLCLKPRLHILDGVVAMEGNGPRSGDPRPLEVLLASTDPVALDAVACRLIDLDPRFVPTTLAGAEGGLGRWQAEEIELVGDDLASLVCRDFAVRRQPALRLPSSRSFPPFLKRWISPRPRIEPGQCTGCATCVEVCPTTPKSLSHRADSKVPHYDSAPCIRCYCCQEACPARAISVKVPLLGRILPHVTAAIDCFY